MLWNHRWQRVLRDQRASLTRRMSGVRVPHRPPRFVAVMLQLERLIGCEADPVGPYWLEGFSQVMCFFWGAGLVAVLRKGGLVHHIHARAKDHLFGVEEP